MATEITVTVLMTAVVTLRERREVAFPRFWKVVHDTETHEVDDEYFRLDAAGVRTAIRKRQAFGYKGFHWSLEVEFSTEAGVRAESWYGFRRVNNQPYSDAEDMLTQAEFDAVEADLQAAIAAQGQP